MHTIVETPNYLSKAALAGMSQDEMKAVTDYLCDNPDAGEEIVGTGGCRKIRFAGKGKGKSGGYRVITFYAGVNLPVFLLTVFGKGAKANITKAEANTLKTITKQIEQTYGR